MTTYGLPRVIVQFLRHMEAHRDGLKWNITDGSHKITLTLTWTFRKKGKETLWDKLQRTLRLTRSCDEPNGIPQELTRFLDSSPKRPLAMSPVRRQLSWSKAVQQAQRQNSLHSLCSPPGSRSLSRTRFSWPGASSPIAIRPPVKRQTSTPLPSSYSPHLIRSDSSTSAASRVRLSYRTEEDLEQSLEDLMERTRVQTQEKLNAIREEWNRSMAECSSWPRRTQSADNPQVRSMSTLTTPHSSIELLDSDSAVSSSTMMAASSGVAAVSGVIPTPISAATSSAGEREAGPGSQQPQNLKGINDTVQKCLSSCDKILYRHSTPIT